MTVTAAAQSLKLASTIVYRAIKLIFFNGMTYRRDIADYLLHNNLRYKANIVQY